MNDSELIKDVAAATSSKVVVRDFQFAADSGNELLCFLKPECFLARDPECIRRLVAMALEKIGRQRCRISGVLRLDGKTLDKAGIMDRHYGFINKLSKNASRVLGDSDRDKIYRRLEITRPERCEVLGGHEFLRKFPGFTEESLDALWATKKSVKLQGGFYVQKYAIEDAEVVLVNAFHPAQLRWYTNQEHRIAVFLLYSDTDWKTLRSDLAGDTFPERARPDSIRGEIFANASRYGMDKVTVSNNCVHLSAGPFEALFEVNNFLMNIAEVKFDLGETNMARKMLAKGLSLEDVAASMANPTAGIDGAGKELFNLTEDRDSEDAISEYIRHYRKTV